MKMTFVERFLEFFRFFFRIFQFLANFTPQNLRDYLDLLLSCIFHQLTDKEIAKSVRERLTRNLVFREMKLCVNFASIL